MKIENIFIFISVNNNKNSSFYQLIYHPMCDAELNKTLLVQTYELYQYIYEQHFLYNIPATNIICQRIDKKRDCYIQLRRLITYPYICISFCPISSIRTASDFCNPGGSGSILERGVIFLFLPDNNFYLPRTLCLMVTCLSPLIKKSHGVSSGSLREKLVITGKL